MSRPCHIILDRLKVEREDNYIHDVNKSCQDYYTKLTKKFGKSGVMNIIEFAESEQGLNFKLYPMQKLIFKLMFRLPLSDKLEDNTIEIPDKYNENVLFKLSEIEAVNYLHAESYMNMNYEDYIASDEIFVEILFFLGRRGSKTTMVSIIYAYKIYLLVKIQNPHRYFNVSTSDPIALIVVSNTEDGAIRQFQSLKQIISGCKILQPHLKGQKGNEQYLATPRLLSLENGKVKKQVNGDIKILASAPTNKVRGVSAIAVGMDEYCHFRDTNVKNKVKPLDAEIYEALVPAVSGYVTPSGVAFGQAFVFSSPNGKRGEGYRKYQLSFNRKDVLMIRTPSHFVNRNLASQFIRRMYEESEASARQEFGAEFLDIMGGFIHNPHRLKAMVNMRYPNTLKNSRPKGKYLLSVDLAQSGDGLVFAVAHKERLRPPHLCVEPDEDYEGIAYENYLAKNNIGVLDYYIKLTPEEEGGVIPHTLVIETFKIIYKSFNIVKTTIDQWNYQVYSELIAKEGIVNMEQFELFLATDMSNSLVARNFNRMQSDGRLTFPNTFISDGTFDDFLGLVEVQKGRNIIKVFAGGNGHDDTWSAISRVLYMVEEEGKVQDLMVGSSMISMADLNKSVKNASSSSEVIEIINRTKKESTPNLKIKKWSPKNKG
jgi:hypothetical protein